MDVLWPWSLILLAAIPLIIAAYIWVLRRKQRFAVRYSSLALVREVLTRQSHLRRHLPFALFMMAMASLVVALARPVTIMSVPADQTTIVLTMDVSSSMRATDIPPSRLAAAEAAAISFMQAQRSTTHFAIVVFSGFAELIQPPTTDQEKLRAAITSLTTGTRTAVGSGILKAIDAIAEVDENVAPSTSATGATVVVTPVPNGAYVPDIIVLLTDGVSNAGVRPLEAARQAADRGIRIYTIGFGTEAGSMPGGGPGGGMQGGGSFRAGIDEAMLKQISAMTGGSYYYAASAKELNIVFQNLPTYLITKHEVMEISVIFVALGALLATAAVILAQIWRPILG